MKSINWLALLVSFSVSTLSLGKVSVQVKTFKSSDIKKLKLKNPNGNINLKGHKLSESTVHINPIKNSDSCSTQVFLKDKTLHVTVKESNSFFSFSNCQIDLHLSLPQSADLDIDLGSGDSEVSHFKGKFEAKLGSGNLAVNNSQFKKTKIRTGSGDLYLEGVTSEGEFNLGSGNLVVKKSQLKDIHIKSGSGNVNLSDLEGDGHIKLGSGNLKLTYPKLPKKGELKINAGSGNSLIQMPKTAKVNVKFKAGSGTYSSELGSDPSSKYLISVKTGSGNLKIKAL